MTSYHSHKLYEIWDQVPVTYYQDGVRKNPLQRIWHGIKANTAVNILKQKKFKNLLDVGCASGHMISRVSRSFPGVSCTGLDVYDKAIKYAKATYPNIRFRIGDAHKLPFKNNSFDAIICYETIEHVEHPAAVLRELKRVLKPGGRIILAMDSGNWLFRIVWAIWERSRGAVWQHAHLHPFTHNELESLIKKSGLTVQSKRFTHLGMEVVFVLSS